MASQSAVRSLEAQVAQIPQLKEMLEVESKSTILQAEVVGFGSEKSTDVLLWMGQKMKFAQLQARCNELWHLPDPGQYSRDEGYISQEM